MPPGPIWYKSCINGEKNLRYVIFPGLPGYGLVSCRAQLGFEEGLAKRRGGLRVRAVTLAAGFNFLSLARALICRLRDRLGVVLAEPILKLEACVCRVDLNTLFYLPLIRVGVEVQSLKDLPIACKLMLGAIYYELSANPLCLLPWEREIHALHEIK